MVKKEKNKFKFYREFLKSSDINQILFKKEKSIDIQLFKYEDIEKSNSSYGQNNLDKLTLLDKPDKPLEASFEKKEEFKINSFLKKDSSLKDNQTSLIDDKKYEYSNNILIEKELIFKKKGYEEGYKKGYEEGNSNGFRTGEERGLIASESKFDRAFSNISEAAIRMDKLKISLIEEGKVIVEFNNKAVTIRYSEPS
jgi:flagellar biosynthesis/type III secretory pathway protein FliH